MNKTGKKIIAIDCGKRNMKAKSGLKEMVYKNAYSPRCADEKQLGLNTFNVLYDGQEYTIGENGGTTFAGEGKDGELHIVCALTAITHFLDPEEENDDIYVMYGESVNRYFDEEQKKRIKKKLEGKHEITVNSREGGHNYSFRIKYVHILPEGSGIVLQNLKDNQGTRYIVDIGGATINFLTTINGRPILESSMSFPLGMNKLRSEIQKKLAIRNFGNIDETLIDEYILDKNKNRTTSFVRDIIQETIVEQFTEFDRRLLNYLDKDIHKILQLDQVLFIGGGSEILRDEIENFYRGATVVKDPLLSNVRGFYEFGTLAFEEGE